MSERTRPTFSSYARQKIVRTLLDLIASTQGLTWSGIADDITETRKIQFQRINFNRLREGKLGDDNVEIIVQWIETKFDKEFRAKLVTQGIFDEVGRSSRDYYFHLPAGNVVEDLNKQMLSEYAGVYLVAPSEDANTYLPLPFLRRFFADNNAFPEFRSGSRTLDIKQYVSERSFLVLKPTKGSYFYAAEFPMSFLLGKTVGSMSEGMIYEGVGVVSANSIHVNLRDCLSRVPKSHTIVVQTKTKALLAGPRGLSFYVSPSANAVRSNWEQLKEEEIEHLRQEHSISLSSPMYLSGPSQISGCPVANLRRSIGLTFAREHVFLRKPRNFFRNPTQHFIRPDLIRTSDVERIIEHPLAIGALE